MKSRALFALLLLAVACDTPEKKPEGLRRPKAEVHTRETRRSEKMVPLRDIGEARAEFVRTINAALLEEGMDLSVRAVGDGATLQFVSPICKLADGWEFVQQAADNARNVGFQRVECAVGDRVTFEREL